RRVANPSTKGEASKPAVAVVALPLSEQALEALAHSASTGETGKPSDAVLSDHSLRFIHIKDGVLKGPPYTFEDINDRVLRGIDWQKFTARVHPYRVKVGNTWYFVSVNPLVDVARNNL